MGRNHLNQLNFQPVLPGTFSTRALDGLQTDLMFLIKLLQYRCTSRTAVPILTGSSPRVDSSSTFSTAVSPGAPRCPQHRQRTRLFLVAQPGSRKTSHDSSHKCFDNVPLFASTHSSSPLLPTLADADSTSVARCGVVAGPLPHLKSDATTAAALAPGRPGSPATIPGKQTGNINAMLRRHTRGSSSISMPAKLLCFMN